ncbi:MAG: hypothetical protein ACI4WX_01540, partial [Aristaeellaceae bacterium]
MNKSIIRALDASLSSLTFTDRMQQNVLRQIQLQRVEQAQADRKSGFKGLVTAAAVVTMGSLLLVAANLFGKHPGQIGDPINQPPLAHEEVTFQPLGTDTPSAADETAEPTITPTAVPTVTLSPSPTATPTVSPSPTPTATPTATPSPTPTASPTAAPSPTPTATPTASPSPTPTVTPTAAPSPTPTATPTASPSPTPTVT